jgi:transposase-like protein
MENILSNESDDQIDNVLVSGNQVVLPVEEKKRSTKKIPDETRAKVQEMIKSGKTMREVAKLLGISKSTVSTVSKESLAVSEQIPEILSESKTEPMDDSAFISAINGTNQQVVEEVSLKQPINKARQASILNKFMNLGQTGRGPAEPADATSKKGSKTVDDLLSKLKGGRSKKSIDFSESISVKEDFQDKSVYITKITMNVDTFPEVLKDHIKPDRDGYIAKICKMSISDLHQTLKLLETVRSSNNMANQMKYLLYGASSLIEVGSQRFLGLQSQGYAQMVRQQEAEIQSCLREIAINNVERYKTIEKPEVRLVTVLVTTLLATDSRNRMERVRSEFKSKPVNPEAEKKYEDL